MIQTWLGPATYNIPDKGTVLGPYLPNQNNVGKLKYPAGLWITLDWILKSSKYFLFLLWWHSVHFWFLFIGKKPPSSDLQHSRPSIVSTSDFKRASLHGACACSQALCSDPGVLTQTARRDTELLTTWGPRRPHTHLARTTPHQRSQHREKTQPIHILTCSGNNTGFSRFWKKTRYVSTSSEPYDSKGLRLISDSMSDLRTYPELVISGTRWTSK